MGTVHPGLLDLASVALRWVLLPVSPVHPPGGQKLKMHSVPVLTSNLLPSNPLPGISVKKKVITSLLQKC